jgi:putative Flp pilus-assembly TadE/G-like protein
LIKAHKRQRPERGQTLILIMAALPLFFALMAFVVDGGNVLVHKRNLQNAADAAALAVAQNIDHASAPPTCGTYGGQSGNAACNALASEYSSRNGVAASIHRCNDADPTHPTDTNCWAYPYVDTHNVSHADEVEVRLHQPVTTFFVGAADALLHGGVATTFTVSARAVAQTDQVLGVTTIPGQTFTGSTTVVAGGTHTFTDMVTLNEGSGVAFAMSRVCNSISYTGAASGTWDQAVAAGFPGSASALGVFATNGGVFFSGNAPKKMKQLAFDQGRCMNAPNHDPDSPPSGTNQCTAKAWGTPPGTGTDSNNLCVQTLVNIGSQPISWPVKPPTLPTPLPAGTAFNPSTDYPSKCADISSAPTVGNNWANTHPPGIYCVSGSGTNLQFSSNGIDLTNGDGYTFFALNGATISTSGNGLAVKFYWPTANCNDVRPTITRYPTYVCFGRTISNYDPEMLFYSSSPSSGGNCAICLQGQSGNLTGDIFATKPDAFPPIPTLTQTGGIVKVAGGALSAGQGFIECWNLQISGNTGNYQGTGAGLVLPGGTHTTTDPSTTIINPGSTGAATTVATTLGTTLDLSQ